ncbi:MAG: phage tail protein [Candidatus Promineifilaceae bacterium]|nr:phage tail protein [Candidatus Promineifilaceae bacterium]
MATQRDLPYMNFNFLVDLGTGDTNSIQAGFQEVSGLNMEINTADYRNGNEKTNHVRKVLGMHSFGDVTLRRGVIGSLDLYEWLDQARNGDQDAARNVTIQLLDEAREGTVMTWRLTNARPIRYTAPSFNATGGSEVAIEELVLSVEALDIE